MFSNTEFIDAIVAFNKIWPQELQEAQKELQKDTCTWHVVSANSLYYPDISSFDNLMVSYLLQAAFASSNYRVEKKPYMKYSFRVQSLLEERK